MTGEFPAQRTSNAENVFIWWRHHEIVLKADEPALAYNKPQIPTTPLVQYRY